MTTKPRLSYFSARGLVEPIRFLLLDAKVDYERNDFGMWGPGMEPPKALTELKQSGVLDFGSVPLWEEEGLKLVQSASIARHLARKYGYNGSNEHEAAKIDSYIEGCKDTVQALRKVMNVSEDQKKKVWEATLKEDVPKWFAFFETILSKNGTGYLVGNKVSIADFYVALLVEDLKAVDVSVDAFPHLKKHQEAIHSRPNIAPYVNDPNRYPPQTPRLVPK